METKRIRLCKSELLILTFIKPVILTQGRGGGVGGVRPAKQNAKCLGLDIQIIPSKLITTNPTHLACYHKGNQNKEYSGL